MYPGVLAREASSSMEAASARSAPSASALQASDGTGEAVDGDRLGRRFVTRAEEGLDAEGDRVHDGRGVEHKRQAERALRVTDRPLRFVRYIERDPSISPWNV
jgi:hypothetical protein